MPSALRVRCVQMRDAHGVGPVAMDLGVDAPLQRNQTRRMLDDGAVDVEDKDVFGRTVVFSVLRRG
jgi:hypothetical protein